MLLFSKFQGRALIWINMNRLTMGSPARDRIAHETNLTRLTLPIDPLRFSSATLCDTTVKISLSPRGVNHTPTPIGSEMPITETNMVPNIGSLP